MIRGFYFGHQGGEGPHHHVILKRNITDVLKGFDLDPALDVVLLDHLVGRRRRQRRRRPQRRRGGRGRPQRLHLPVEGHRLPRRRLGVGGGRRGGRGGGRGRGRLEGAVAEHPGVLVVVEVHVPGEGVEEGGGGGGGGGVAGRARDAGALVAGGKGGERGEGAQVPPVLLLEVEEVVGGGDGGMPGGGVRRQELQKKERNRFAKPIFDRVLESGSSPPAGRDWWWREARCRRGNNRSNK